MAVTHTGLFVLCRHPYTLDARTVEEDELVEVTPESIRLRKKWLLEHERKRASRSAA